MSTGMTDNSELSIRWQTKWDRHFFHQYSILSRILSRKWKKYCKIKNVTYYQFESLCPWLLNKALLTRELKQPWLLMKSLYYIILYYVIMSTRERWHFQISVHLYLAAPDVDAPKTCPPQSLCTENLPTHPLGTIYTAKTGVVRYIMRAVTFWAAIKVEPKRLEPFHGT